MKRDRDTVKMEQDMPDDYAQFPGSDFGVFYGGGMPVPVPPSSRPPSPDPMEPRGQSVAVPPAVGGGGMGGVAPGAVPSGFVLASCDPTREGTVASTVGGGGGAIAANEAQKRIRRRDFNIVYWGNSIHALAQRMQYRFVHRIQYAIMQRELCPTTGRPHWQMYIEFKNPESIVFVKEELLEDNTANVQIRLSAREACRAYCRKVATRMPGPQTEVGPFEFGTWSTVGAGQKMQMVREAIVDGREVADIAMDDPNTVFRHRASLEWFADAMRQREAQSENREVTVRLFIGSTGSGKTHLARQEALYYSSGDAGKIFILDSGGKENALWFDGYRYGRTLIIDDYDSWISVSFLLRLLDKYPLRLPVKGGTKWALYREVWITSNKPLEQWTEPNGRQIDPRHFDALYRRISWILYMPERGSYQIVKKPHEPLRPDLPTCELFTPTPPTSTAPTDADRASMPFGASIPETIDPASSVGPVVQLPELVDVKKEDGIEEGNTMEAKHENTVSE